VAQRGAERAERITDTKKEAVEKATRQARKELEQAGQLGQVVIKKADGTIQEERTYGRDPERHPG
jgi:Uncharacterized protein conserved in bacteria (DUF2188)